MMNIKLSTGTSALTLMLAAFAPQAFAQGVNTRPVKPTLDSLQAQITQLTAAFQAEHTARLAAEAAEVTARGAAIAAVTTSLNTLSTTVGTHTTTLASLQTSTATLQTTVTGYSTRVTALETKTQFMSVSGTTTLFTSTNVQILNGDGSTDTVNGVGNLIVGYNEDSGYDRTGSHNLVVGSFHGYSSYAGAVFGYNNQITGNYATVLGGGNNSSSGYASAILGGNSNFVSGQYSSISGGALGNASGIYSSIGGGIGSLETRTYGWRAGSIVNP